MLITTRTVSRLLTSRDLGPHHSGDRPVRAALRSIRAGCRTDIPVRLLAERFERNPATVHMFIVNLLHMRACDSLITSHPPIEKRIAALQQMAGGSSRVPSFGRVGEAVRRSPRTLGFPTINCHHLH